MSEKAICYLTEIASLDPIPEKDRIMLAKFTTNNWQVIVSKEFNVGDKCIYIESDSLLPDIPEFEFLKKRCWSVKYNAHRIKRMNMGGVVSEGIVFSFKDLKRHLPDNTWTLPVDSDLTNLLKIRRIEDEVPEFNPNSHKKSWLQNKIDFLLWKLLKIRREVMGINFYDFPGYLVKTDETQSQSIPQLFETMKGMQVYESVKCDGMSTTFALYKGIFTISSRNRTIYKQKIKKAIKDLTSGKKDKYLQWPQIYVAALYDVPSFIKEGIALSVETCGGSIQKNRLGLKNYDCFLFNVYDIKERKFFQFHQFNNYIGKLNTVPIIREDVKFLFQNIEQMEDYASQITYVTNGTPAEGIIFREFDNSKIYMSDPFNKMHAMISFKIINPKFKEKYDH